MTSITLLDRLAAFGGAALMGCIIFVVARSLHLAISRDDERKRIQGTPIIHWVTVCYFVGAIWGCVIADNVSYYTHEVVGGMGGFGILVGWVIGMGHGFVRLAFDRSRTFESKGHSKADPTNPYAPPGEISKPNG